MSLIAEKTSVLHRSIRDANEAANEDSKSSAGDKFETGREMITQEIAKATQQLATLGEMRRALEKIRPNRQLESVGLGTLAHTSEGWFFFSVSLGNIQVEGQEVYALSMASSPIFSHISFSDATQAALSGYSIRMPRQRPSWSLGSKSVRDTNK